MIELAIENLKANKGRLIATVVAIVAGVAFLSAGLMFTDAIRSSLGGEIERQYAGVDAAVVPDLDGAGARLPATVLPLVTAVDGVDAAVPELSGSVSVLASGESKPEQRTGRLWNVDDPIGATTVVGGRAPEASGEIAIDRGTAEDEGFEIGDQIELATASGRISTELVGITAFGEQDALDEDGTVSMAPEDAFAAITGGPEEYTQILVTSDRSATTLIDDLRAAMPDGVKVLDRSEFVESQLGEIAQIADFLRPVLIGFSLLALFVCGFVIANTFTVVIAQRTRELALLRAIGATPKQVKRSVRVEALVIGLVASIIGVAVGLLLVLAATAILAAFDVELPGAGAKLSVGTVVVSLLVGTGVTWLSVWRASRRASRVAPVEAMRSSALETPTTRGRSSVWLVILVIGAGLTLLAAFSKIGWLLGVGALVFVIALLASGPLLARLAAHLTGGLLRRFGMAGRLAGDNVERNPKRVSATSNALVIGVLLIALVTTAGGTLKEALIGELDKLSGTDLLMVADASGIPDDIVVAAGKIDGVKAVAGASTATATVNGGIAQISGVDIDAVTQASGLTATSGSLEDLQDGQIAALDISSVGGGGGPQGVDRQQVSVGDTVEVATLDGTTKELEVGALIEIGIDSALLDYVVTDTTFDSLFGPHPANTVYVSLEDRSNTTVKDELEALVADYSTITVIEGNFISQLVAQIFDVLIAGVNGLLGMSVFIAAIGIVNTMTLSIIERRREIGLLRAVGMMPNETRRMIRAESLVIALFGTIVGLVAGTFLGFCLTRPIGIEGTGFSFEWDRLGLVALAGLVIGLVASWLPARRVSRMDVLDALRAE